MRLEGFEVIAISRGSRRDQPPRTARRTAHDEPSERIFSESSRERIVETVQPKPLLTLRGALFLFVLTFVLVVFGWFVLAFGGERGLSECGDRAPQWHNTVERDFTFFPPGFDCVFLNDRGEVVGRVRAP
jgi:hypothetical protein